jgi:hypothetical protein
MAVDEDTIELLERRMAERVESRVRGRLFAFYGGVGGAIMVVLGYFGYDIIQSTRASASKFATDAVAPTVAKAEAAATLATQQAADAAARLDVLNDWLARRSAKLDEIEDKVQTTMGTIERVAGQLQTKLDAVSGQIQTAEETLNDQRERAAELFAGQGDLSQLADQLVKLSEEVKTLDERVNVIYGPMTASAGPDAVTDGPGPGPGPGPEVPIVGAGEPPTSQMALQTIIDTSSDIVKGADNPQAPTVYLQFAGVEREVAQALSAALARENFTLPGAERTGVAAGLHEVRFFFDADSDAAGRLTEAVNDWLTANGYAADVRVRNATDFGKAKPKPGVLELWLEPKPA